MGYDPKSCKAEEFINNEEILESLEYAKKNKGNKELIEGILDKANRAKGLTHREAAVLLECDDEELTDYENDLNALASRKILTLSHQSNTDLHLAYGPANLPALSEYDQNYTTLLRNLVAYADCLIKNGFKAEAVPVLEFGISIDSDIRANYTLLAELYKEQGNASKIQELIAKAASLDSMMRSAILEQLHTLQNA